MAQSSMAAKFVSRALNNGGRCSRAMHDGVGTKKGLHNTDCVVGLVADSMGRSRVKLTAADVERTGITRVGPAPDILHQTCGILLGTRLTPKLGQIQAADFHRSAGLAAEEECDKPGKNQLPCHRTVIMPGMSTTPKYKGKGSCEKLCMPCCEPARIPPECMSIYKKTPCQFVKNPRPSFSECRKKFPFRHTKCECEVPAKPMCAQKKKNESQC